MTIGNTGTDKAHRAGGEPTTGGRRPQQQETSHETCHDGSRIRRGLAADDTYRATKSAIRSGSSSGHSFITSAGSFPSSRIWSRRPSHCSTSGAWDRFATSSRGNTSATPSTLRSRTPSSARSKPLDRLRQRHKVEVKPGSIWFDPSRSKAGRHAAARIAPQRVLG